MSDAVPPKPRLSGRDLIGPALIFLGAFLLAVTVALPTLVAGKLREIPLSIDLTSVSDSTDPASTRIFDRCSLGTDRAAVVEARLQQQRRLVAVQPSDSEVITLQAGTALGADHLVIDGEEVDPEDPRPGSDAPEGSPAADCAAATLAAAVDRTTINRSTALPAGAAEIQYDQAQAPVTATDRAGYTYLLPYGFDAGDDGSEVGSYFDITTRTTVPLVVTGREEVAGREAVLLTAEIGETDLANLPGGAAPRATITAPASWFGEFPGVDPDTVLTADLHHRATHRLAVDDTGVILDEQVTVAQDFRFRIGTPGGAATDAYRLTALAAEFAYDEQSRTDAADFAADRADRVRLWGVILPIVAGLLGVLALLAGAFSGRLWPTRTDTDTDTDQSAGSDETDRPAGRDGPAAPVEPPTSDESAGGPTASDPDR